MNRALLAVLGVIAAIISCGEARSEITTVILSDDTQQLFKVAADDTPTQTATLTFKIGPAFTPNAEVLKCTLRVVPVPLPPPKRRADQDVSIWWNAQQVGQWSAYNQTTEPYTVELMPQACAPGSSVFTLRTESKHTAWEYYGGGTATPSPNQPATPSANQPRLIVTYDSPSPARAGDATEWRYAEPTDFFSSVLWNAPGTMLANPVSYDGAVYVAAGSSSAGSLYRVAGARNVANWTLGFNLIGKSFAFATAWGDLQLITKNAIYSCDLNTLRSAGKLNCLHTPEGEKITVNKSETPAMGPDGSLYFKNVDADGSIVARNSSLREIWRTKLMLQAASPIALSQNGQYAFVLANLPVQSNIAASMIALLRIDTATGDTVWHEISYKDKENAEIKPFLQDDLFRPAVASKMINGRNRDYVFVAGNTSDEGLLQLITFEEDKPLVWTRDEKEKMATAPVLSADSNSLFAVAGQDGRTITRYDWYSTTAEKTGASSKPLETSESLPVPPETSKSLPGVSTLLIDGSDSLYVATGQSLYAYRSASKQMSNGQKLAFTPTLQFTTDGALIGYTDTAIYDLSPKAAPTPPWPPALATGTIYSAANITVPAEPGVKKGDQVILKGTTIALPRRKFHWPVGATLRLQSVQ